VQFLEHIRAKRASGTASQYALHFKKYLVPRLGNKPLDAITPDVLARLHLRLNQQPVLANRILDTASSLYGWAARQRFCPPTLNPASKGLVERYKEHGKERFLSKEELRRLGQALREIRSEGRWSPFALAAIPLLLLTGCRRDEIRLAQWNHIDWDRRLLNLHKAKAGKRSVPRSASKLAAMKRLYGHSINDTLSARRR
jgi:integrase